jgi:hypothetical protein
MKTLLAIRESEYAWAQDAFPSVHPLLLPLCNKPFIEYLIDFSILTRSTAIRLLTDGSLTAVEHYCENGSRWGIPISFGSLHEEDDIKSLIGKNRRFCGSERVMIISGFTFIRYDKQQNYAVTAARVPAGQWSVCPGGSILLTGLPSDPEKSGREDTPLLSLLPLDNMASYYAASMEALETGSERYVLPGYGGEPGCAIGRNVVISKTVEIRKPVSIGNNVQLLSGAVIGPSAIIGSNVVIDRESVIASSIVFDNTYIGEQLEVNERIASGNLLTEPHSGVSIAMQDPHLLSDISRGPMLKTLTRKLVHALAALLLIILLCIPFILIWLPLRLAGHWQSKTVECLADTQGETIRLKKIEHAHSGILDAVAENLSLDRFFLLFRVLRGQLSLIGNTLTEADKPPVDSRGSLHLYRPGVFSYAEAEQWPANECDVAIVERFHLVHSSPISDIALTVKALVNRHQEHSIS